MTRLIALAMSAAAALLFFALPAQAACNLCVCLIGTNAVGFGVYSPVSASDSHSTGEVNMTCTSTALTNQTLAYDIKLNGGNGSIADRTMQFLTADLHYNLYTANNYGIVWGDGSGSSQFISGGGTISIGDVLLKTHTIYANLPGGQNVPGGLYTDLITVTVTY